MTSFTRPKRNILPCWDAGRQDEWIFMKQCTILNVEQARSFNFKQQPLLEQHVSSVFAFFSPKKSLRKTFQLEAPFRFWPSVHCTVYVFQFSCALEICTLFCWNFSPRCFWASWWHIQKYEIKKKLNIWRFSHLAGLTSVRPLQYAYSCTVYTTAFKGSSTVPF